jgi:hypothetical protein
MFLLSLLNYLHTLVPDCDGTGRPDDPLVGLPPGLLVGLLVGLPPGLLVGLIVGRPVLSKGKELHLYVFLCVSMCYMYNNNNGILM